MINQSKRLWAKYVLCLAFFFHLGQLCNCFAAWFICEAVRKEDALHQKGCQDVDKVLFVPLRLPSSHKIMSIIPNSQRDSPTRVLVLCLLRLVSFPLAPDYLWINIYNRLILSDRKDCRFASHFIAETLELIYKTLPFSLRPPKEQCTCDWPKTDARRIWYGVAAEIKKF